ncbi:Cell division protein FtsA [Bacillus sp. THAF10]|nr:Cell division protein FtsA [Bacillus sp. THAF10]
MIFALDIGTRSVVGLLLEEEQQQFRIIDFVVKEHDERAMLDGQIHDIFAVSKVITYVKKELEKKHGPLSKVCVAAAGRALKTQTAFAVQNIKGKTLFNEEDIFLLELSAVQEAQRKLLTNEKDSIHADQYFCVGYSVLRYYLDEDEIGSLLDQRGEQASVEVISTFLPKIVVESLISALQRANLQLEALTLEPIAAINVLIPPSMRRLNLALVDIGAGTSDIAISLDGTITAYGMVPNAGDEITEALSDAYLLDFPQAEKVKRQLMTEDEIRFTDILGFEQTLHREEMVNEISPSIEKLATAITGEIFKQNNNKSPKAVMLVGGGSLTPTLPATIAAKLGLPENRVAIRGVDAITSLQPSEVPLKGPEFITPIGIAIASKQKPIEYVSVTVNEVPVRLFDVKKLTVGDSLLAAGVNIHKLVGKPGLALMVNLNGKNITVPGTFGEAPLLFKNGIAAQSLDSIKNGDEIIVQKGKDGDSPSVTVAQMIGSDQPETKTMVLNDEKVELSPSILVNDNIASLDTVLSDRDSVRYTIPTSIKEVLLQTDSGFVEGDLEPFYVYINGEKAIIDHFSLQVKKNGVTVPIMSSFENNDEIEVITHQTPSVKMLAIHKQYEIKQEISVTYHQKKVVLEKMLLEFYRNGTKLSEDDFIEKGDHLQVMVKRKEPFIFQDIFRFVDIEKPKGAGIFELKKNGEEASFYDFIENGDVLEIHWQKKNVPS